MKARLRGGAAAGERLPGPTAIDDAELREHASIRGGPSQRHDGARAAKGQVDRAVASNLLGSALYRDQRVRRPADLNPTNVAQAGGDPNLDRAGIEPPRRDAHRRPRRAGWRADHL